MFSLYLPTTDFSFVTFWYAYLFSHCWGSVTLLRRQFAIMSDHRVNQNEFFVIYSICEKTSGLTFTTNICFNGRYLPTAKSFLTSNNLASFAAYRRDSNCDKNKHYIYSWSPLSLLVCCYKWDWKLRNNFSFSFFHSSLIYLVQGNYEN